MARPKVFKSDRPDGRFISTAGLVHHELKHLRPALAFDPSFTPRQFSTWQGKVRRKLRELMALPKPPPQPAPKMIRRTRRDGYELQRWELYPEPHSVLPVLLLVPDGASASKRAPGVICLPGSSKPKEFLAGEKWREPLENPWGDCQHMAWHFARRGCVALAMDNPATGELADPVVTDWRRQSWELIWLGRPYECLSVFHKLIALKWLKSLPFVDTRRIAACGHSLGAKPALHLGVLEPTIRAVVWNDNAGDWRVRQVVRNLQSVAPWHYIPQFVRWFDYIDLMAAMAPRPLLISEGGRGRDLRKIRKAYALAGAPGNFKVSYMPNFARASSRTLDRRKMPEGLTAEQYARYANYDGDHYFKADLAVPWLCGVLDR